MPRRFRKVDIAIVRWLDAVSSHDDELVDPVPVVTAGIVHTRNKEKTVIAAGYWRQTNEWGPLITIPAAMVTEFTIIQKGIECPLSLKPKS